MHCDLRLLVEHKIKILWLQKEGVRLKRKKQNKTKQKKPHEISVLISWLQRQLQFDLKEFACKDVIAKESFISRVLWSSVFQPFAILILFKKSTEDIDSKIVIISLLTEGLVLREL